MRGRDTRYRCVPNGAGGAPRGAGEGGEAELADFTPAFLWLLRDFYLTLEEDGRQARGGPSAPLGQQRERGQYDYFLCAA